MPRFKLPKFRFSIPSILRRPARTRIPEMRSYARTGEARYIPRINTYRSDGRRVRVLASRYDEISIRDYDRVRMYPVVRDAVRTYTNALSRASFHFASADQVMADLAMQELADPVRRLIKNLVRGGMQFGYQACEKVWAPKFEVKLSTGQGAGGQVEKSFPFIWSIKRFASLDPSDTRILLDGRTGIFAGIRQFASANRDEAEIPALKLIHYVNDQEFDSNYGCPTTKAAVPFVELAESVYDDMALYSRIFAVPFKKGRHKPGITVNGLDESGNEQRIENKDLMRDLLDGIEAGHSLSLPAEYDKNNNPLWDLEIVTVPAEDRYVDKLDHINDMIRMSMAFPMMASSDTPDSGTYNLGETQIELFLANAESILDELATVLNSQLLSEFRLYNFGSEAPPLTIVFEPLDVKVKRALLTALIEMLGSQAEIRDQDGNVYDVDWPKLGQDNGIPFVRVSPGSSIASQLIDAARKRLAGGGGVQDDVDDAIEPDDESGGQAKLEQPRDRLGRWASTGGETDPNQETDANFDAYANDGERWIPKDSAENLKRGRDAISHVLRTKQDAHDAMFRPDIGHISFLHGEAGTASKQFKDGYGLQHILARRKSTGQDVQAVLESIPTVIDKGTISGSIGARSRSRYKIQHDGHSVIISPDFNGETLNWMVTAYE